MRKTLTILLLIAAFTSKGLVKSERNQVFISGVWFTIIPPVYSFLPPPAPLAINYYVDATNGNDTYSGITVDKPWKTLAKASSFSYPAGVINLLLKSGEKWREPLTINRSNFNVSNYGTDINIPEINGFKTITSLTNIGGGLYTVSIPECDGYLGMVRLAGIVQRRGQTPDYTAALPDKGWRKCLTKTSSATSTSYIVGFPSGTYNKGEEIDLKSFSYLIQNVVVDTIIADTLKYKKNPLYAADGALDAGAPVANRYFFQVGQPRMCNLRGEWCFNATTKVFTIFLGAEGLDGQSLEVATLANGITVAASRNDVSISNVGIYGTNKFAIFSDNSTRVTVDKFNVEYHGGKGIAINGSQNSKVLNGNVNWCLQNGITMRSSSRDTATVMNTTIKNIGLIEGAGSKYSNDYVAVYIFSRNIATVSYNFLDSNGHNGISFQGKNILIYRNIISNYAQILADNGGVYTHSEDSANTFSGNKVIGNFIFNGYGDPAGTGGTSYDVAGVYFDGNALHDIEASDNVVWNVNATGYQYNNIRNLVMRNNIAFNVMNEDIYAARRRVTIVPSMNIKNNLFYRFLNPQYIANTRRNHLRYDDLYLGTADSMQPNLFKFFNIDSNYYNEVSLQRFKLDGKIFTRINDSTVITTNGTFPYNNLLGWQGYTGRDLNSNGMVDFGTDKAKLFVNMTAISTTFNFNFIGINPKDNSKDLLGEVIVQPYSGVVVLYKDDLQPSQRVRLRIRVGR